MIFFCISATVLRYETWCVGGKTWHLHRWFNSRRQLIYRITHGLAEVVQFLPVHSPIKSSTDIGTGQPELDIILFIDHCVLAMCESRSSHRGKEKMYLDHCEKDANGAEDSLGWCDAGEFLREIQGIYGHIQRGGDTLLPLRSLGIFCHGWKAR